MSLRQDQLTLEGLSVPEALVRFRTNSELERYLHDMPETDLTEIGLSRGGQAMFGVRLGTGPRHVSVIAGCHADEPVGPMTAQALPVLLRQAAPKLLEEFTLFVMPQMNPDGADRNRPWFGDPLQLDRYLSGVIRELPGDDIEFGFSESDPARPENSAAMNFLKPFAPFHAHFSLHGMAFAEGAWCLICREWAGRGEPFMDAFTGLCERLGVPQHDIDRKGEKGFTRIREGFCTTPRSDAMRAYFLERGDPDTAEKFRPSSMEWIQSLGGDPMCIVSELPLFQVGRRSTSLDRPVTAELREELTETLALDAARQPECLDEIQRRYAIEPMPIDLQIRLQTAIVAIALNTVLEA